MSIVKRLPKISVLMVPDSATSRPTPLSLLESGHTGSFSSVVSPPAVLYWSLVTFFSIFTCITTIVSSCDAFTLIGII